MTLKFIPIKYEELNSRQKENYNFLKVSAVLADYGYMTMRLSDDWQGADFIAQHVYDKSFLKIQLKGRLSFDQKYVGKDIYVAFYNPPDWYLYPHDEILNEIRAGIEGTESWQKQGCYTYPNLSKKMTTMLEQHRIRTNPSSITAVE